MKGNNKNTMTKLPYDKPRLRSIELAAEEVLAIGCKSTTQIASNNISPPCMIRHCAGNGS